MEEQITNRRLNTTFELPVLANENKITRHVSLLFLLLILFPPACFFLLGLFLASFFFDLVN